MQVTFGGTREEIDQLLKSIYKSDLNQLADKVVEMLNAQINCPAIEFRLPVVEVIKQGGAVKELRINGVPLPCKELRGVQYHKELGNNYFEVLVSFRAREVEIHNE